MTDPSEVKISDAEVQEFWDNYNYFLTQDDTSTVDDEREWYRKALAAFLARRVPDAEVEPSPYAWDNDEINMAVAHNACRAHILMGDTQ